MVLGSFPEDVRQSLVMQLSLLAVGTTTVSALVVALTILDRRQTWGRALCGTLVLSGFLVCAGLAARAADFFWLVAQLSRAALLSLLIFCVYRSVRRLRVSRLGHRASVVAAALATLGTVAVLPSPLPVSLVSLCAAAVSIYVIADWSVVRLGPPHGYPVGDRSGRFLALGGLGLALLCILGWLLATPHRSDVDPMRSSGTGAREVARGRTPDDVPNADAPESDLRRWRERLGDGGSAEGRAAEPSPHAAGGAGGAGPSPGREGRSSLADDSASGTPTLAGGAPDPGMRSEAAAGLEFGSGSGTAPDSGLASGPASGSGTAPGSSLASDPGVASGNGSGIGSGLATGSSPASDPGVASGNGSGIGSGSALASAPDIKSGAGPGSGQGDAGGSRLAGADPAGGGTADAGLSGAKAVASDLASNPPGAAPMLAEAPKQLGQSAVPALLMEAEAGDAAERRAATAALERLDREGPTEVPGESAGLSADATLQPPASIPEATPGHEVSRVALPKAGRARDLVIRDDTFYVASWTRGLVVAREVGNGQIVAEGHLDTPGIAAGVALAGDFVVIADYNTLRLVDVANPARPRLHSQIGLPGVLLDVAVVGQHAYVAAWQAGLHVVNLEDPSAPSLIASVDTGGQASDVEVRIGRAYVAAGDAGCVVVDVSRPRHPEIAGAILSAGPIRGVGVSGDRVFLAGYASGVWVFDVSEPHSPQLLSRYDELLRPLDVEVDESIAYISAGRLGLWVVDFRDPRRPRWLATQLTSGAAMSARRRGSRVYLANDDVGLTVLEILLEDTPPLVTR